MKQYEVPSAQEEQDDLIAKLHREMMKRPDRARLYVLPDEAAVAKFHSPPFDRWPKLFEKDPK